MNDHKNGKDTDTEKTENQDDNVLRFPSVAERERARKEQLKQAQKAQKDQKEKQAQYAKQAAQLAQNRSGKEPFLKIGNITPFVRFMLLGFITVQIVIHFLLSPEQKMLAFYVLGFVPGYFTGTMEENSFPPYALSGIITHMMVHGSWMHLAFNSVMGLTLGMFFERRFGTRAAALFFLLCGIGGAAAFFALNPFSTVPVIGASGAISGFFAAALMMIIEQKQSLHITKKSPWPIIGFWVVLMIVLGFVGGSALAWQAHVGGFLSGALIYELMKRGKLKL